jgi:flagella basal body P-ring formation protein FlgA
MTPNLAIKSICLFVIFCAGTASDALSGDVFNNQILIRLNETASVQGSQVLLSSIATVSCDDPLLKKEAEDVEVKLLDLSQASETVTQQFVRIRMIVAGFPMEGLTLAGAEQTVVVFQATRKLTDTDVEEQALTVLSQVWNAGPGDLKVLLQSGFVQTLPKNLRELDGVTLKLLPPARKSLGPISLSAQLWKGGELILTRSAVFDVRRRHRVAVAQISLSREIPLNESSIQFENRFMSTEVDELEPSQILGRTVRGSVVSGSIVQMRDLQTETRSNSDVLVKKGEAIQATAMTSRLRTSVRNIEALEDGRLGDRIRMKNRDSGKEIVGQVLGPGQAIIRVQ